jgi:hypothetical protein
MFAVKCFSYRKSRPEKAFVRVPRGLFAELEKSLAESAGVEKDNHTGYLVTFPTPIRVDQNYVMELFFWFSDYTAVISTDYVLENW